MKRQRITVQLLGQDEPITVECINPDYLRVESEAPKFGLPVKPTEAPMTYMTCVAWAAAKRLGLYDGSLMDWKNRDCTDLDGGDKDDVTEVPPTTTAAATSSP